jgi:hypothetical protein
MAPMLASGITKSATEPEALATMEISREANTRRIGSGDASNRSKLSRSWSARAVPSSPCALIQARRQNICIAPAGAPVPSVARLQPDKPHNNRPCHKVQDDPTGEED